MGFDEENNDDRDDGNSDKNGAENGKKKSISFFGLELSAGVTYTIVIILALIFIRQAFIVLQALN